MSEQPAQIDTALQEQLVAYLDGELDAEASRRIEELLTTDAKVRATMQELDHTWQLLDELDTGGVDERFTRSTLEMVAVAAADEVEQTRAAAPRRRRLRWLAIAVGATAAGLAGFAATAMFWPDPDKKTNERLVENLPVLENLDQYCQVENVEFLRMLQQERLFAEEADDGK
jgi:anti-sigma factor RsiW